MRLIDADALDNMLVGAQAKCKRNGGNFRFGVLSTVRENIREFPIIDAIPVEWLDRTRDKFMSSAYSAISGFGGTNMDEIHSINVVMDMWKKEMGWKSNEDKIGVWEPLGHRPGPLKHPWSEDFRCSLCGYEAYTIFDQPPNRCPECEAKMVEQEAR